MTRQAVEGLRHIATSKCSMLETDLRAKPEILRVRVSPKHIKTHQNTSKHIKKQKQEGMG